MFIKLLLIYIYFYLPIVNSYCYSKFSSTWICDDNLKLNNTKNQNNIYESLLNNKKFENFFLKNYQLSIFKIDNYPLTLHLLNASNNQFKTIIITSKNRFKSNLKQLILQSNNIKYFNKNNIYLPQSLQIISLANNRLEILDARIFFSLKNLTHIDLRNNYLKRILPDLLINRNILLNNNPLDCQCTPEYYQIICKKSTNLDQSIIENKNCLAPYYESQSYDIYSSSYLRFSTLTFICPINSYPPPIIIWSTPFGNLTSINFSNIDLLSLDFNQLIYRKIIALAGPLTARTKHVLHAFDTNHLSITQARASLQSHISCSGINMLGIYTHKFNFTIYTFAQKRALWNIIYTIGFGFFMSLVAGALCVTLKRTSYSGDHMKTPPIYPTLTTNSAARTPPNFELNQWLSLAAANISGTLEQVRDKLRLGVQHVSEHMGRASELLTHSVQHAGGTLRQAAETSAAYLQSFRETSQQRFNTMRVQTLSSIRSSGHFMRIGMNMLTTHVNSLRDYCGVITIYPNHALQQHQQEIQHIENTSKPITTINEDEEDILESTSMIVSGEHAFYVGDLSSMKLGNASGIGQLDTADNSILFTFNNFSENLSTEGEVSGGIGTFHDHNDELVNEPERLAIYCEQRPLE